MRCCTSLLPILLLAAGLAHAEDPPEREKSPPKAEAPAPESAPEPADPEEASKPSADRSVVYVPPSRGSNRVRTGGGTRSPGEAPTLAVLAPDHVGLTWRAQPVLAWFVSGPTDARVDFTLIEADAIEPLIEVTLPGPFEAGVQLVGLEALGVQLESDTSYDWSVALVRDPDQRDLDVVAGAAIRRDPPGEVPAGADPVVALAGAGVWYDAMADLSRALAERPGDAALRAKRASLLEQVGVGAVAAHERSDREDGI